jgi:hypothetical protein
VLRRANQGNSGTGAGMRGGGGGGEDGVVLGGDASGWEVKSERVLKRGRQEEEERERDCGDVIEGRV